MEWLYERYYRELYVYVYGLCKSTALTEDILQETYLKAFTALKDSHTNMRAWLYRVAHNLCLNALKREERFAPEVLTERPLPDEPGSMEEPLQLLLRDEEHRRLWKALLQLDAQKRELLLLQYFGGFGQKEIAAFLHLTPENVRVQAHRAKKELRKKLESDQC